MLSCFLIQTKPLVLSQRGSCHDVVQYDDSDEEHASLVTGMTTKNFPRRRRVCGGFLAVLLGLFIGAAVSVLSILLWGKLGNHEQGIGPVLIGPLDIIPKFPTVPVYFHEDDRYWAAPNSESNELWESVVPNVKGFVEFPTEEARSYGLGPGVPNESSDKFEYFGVSWTHQYHCLLWLRTFIWEALRGEFQAKDFNITDNTDDSIHHYKLNHLAHCLDHLRQTILCHRDMTIEASGMYGDLDGMDIWHICTAPEPADQWIRDHPVRLHRDLTKAELAEERHREQMAKDADSIHGTHEDTSP